MRRVTRLVFVAMVLGSPWGLASSAEAVHWHNSGAVGFSAYGDFMTLSATGGPLTCSGSTMTGTAPSTTAGPTYSISGTITFSGCQLGGVLNTAFHCGYTFTGSAQSGWTTSGTVDLTCGIYQFDIKRCHVGGTVPGTYANGNPASLDMTTGTSLVVSNGTPSTCPLGNGERAVLTPSTFMTTSASPPIITRTA